MEKFKTLKDHVYDYIAEQIMCGKLKPEQRVDETEICSELSISRTPVREAFIQLAAEGILENQARKGFVVRRVDKEQMGELFDVIGLLDGYAAKLACQYLTNQDFKDMKFYVDSAELAITSGNFEMYHKQQLAFHQAYINKCGNEFLIRNIENCKKRMVKKAYEDDSEGNIRKILMDTNNEHREMLELFKARDGEALEKFVKNVHWQLSYVDYDLM